MMSLKSQAELYRLKQLGKNRNYAQQQRYDKLMLKYKSDKIDMVDLQNRKLIVSFLTLEIIENGNEHLLNSIKNSILRHAEDEKQAKDLISLYDDYLNAVRKGLKEKQKAKKNENKNKQNQNH